MDPKDPLTALLLVKADWESNAISDALRLNGLAAAGVEGSQQALMSLLTTAPDVIFISTGTMATEGLSFLRVLRTATGAAASLPVIALGSLDEVPGFAKNEMAQLGVTSEVPTSCSAKVARWVLQDAGLTLPERPLARPGRPGSPPRPAQARPTPRAISFPAVPADTPLPPRRTPRAQPPPPKPAAPPAKPAKPAQKPTSDLPPKRPRSPKRRPPTMPTGVNPALGPSMRVRVDGVTRVLPIQSASQERMTVTGRGARLPLDESLHLYYEGRLAITDAMQDVSVKVLARVRSHREDDGLHSYVLDILAARPADLYQALIAHVLSGSR
ncbi:MAG: hypothetical protein KDA24_30095 [Deltaproteobacteria bacterium]|nr:hypothetical protein [Deltaproteobacteria bacterium]